MIGQSNRVWLNDGTGRFTDTGQLLGDVATKSSREVEIGDVDGDGDVDAWIANQDYANKLFLNNGDGVFTDSGQILDNNPATGGNPLRTRGGRMVDVDADGDLDIIEANQSRQTDRVWVNDGSGVLRRLCSPEVPATSPLWMLATSMVTVTWTSFSPEFLRPFA